MLSIRLFGATQVLLDGQPLAVNRRKSRALLYVIAAHPRPINRRQALTLLWPDHAPVTARHNLRSTLYTLNRALGAHLIVEDETLALADDSQVDVRLFRAGLLSAPDPTRQELTEALNLYTGDFLADFDLPDPVEFEDWVAVEREQYRRLAIRGFTKLSQLDATDGRFRPALQSVEQALAIDPFQEDLQRAALRLHYQAGDRAGAIRRYEDLRKLLDEEMGVPPMAETRALYDAIITDSLPQTGGGRSLPPSPSTPAVFGVRNSPLPVASAAAASTTGQLPFTGRTNELHQLFTWRGAHKLVLVEGGPGIGKTRLVEAFLASRRHDETQPSPLSLAGRARQLESRLPYQPVIEALRGLLLLPEWPMLQNGLDLPSIWLAETAYLLPEIAQAAPVAPPLARTPDESRLWEAVFQFLAALARQRPLSIFMDDLHWADAATLGLLGYLVRQSAVAGIAIDFLATTRPVPPHSDAATLFQTLVREERLARLPLTRLRDEDVLALARQISPSYGYPLGNWLYRGAEGNPFILAELVRHAREKAILLPDGTVNLNLLPTTPVVPQTVYTLIQGRLEHLSESARRALDAAVAVGREFDFVVVARAAALSDDAALDALDELQRDHLIHTVNETRFAFDHNLTMEVAYQEVGELRHRLLHRRVAAALESIHHDRLDEVAGLIAQHYAEGNAPEQASKFAWRAGQRAPHAWRPGNRRQAFLSKQLLDRQRHNARLFSVPKGRLRARRATRCRLPSPCAKLCGWH